MSKRNIWFPAKKNGWGWAKPQTWQGWLSQLLYLSSVALTSYLIDPKEELLNWSIVTVCLTLCLLFLYLVKGEAPSWKWQRINRRRKG
ncbi:hypothetical protein [Marinomonas epiphytica]